MKNKKIAIYPGTFDPITNGHLDLIERGGRLFDEVIVAVSNNRRKQPLFDIEQRLDMVQRVTADMENVIVEGFDELLVDFVIRKKANFIIRGLRAVSDFEYEFQLAAANRRLRHEVETIFLTPSEAHYFTSSSLVREISFYNGEVVSFVPDIVNQALAERWKQEKKLL